MMTTSTASRILTPSDLRLAAPSIFAPHAFERMSSKYRFAPTSEVLDILADRGYRPVKAMQSRTRIEGKRGYTKHLVRLRHDDFLQPMTVGDELPELVLTNSHDGSSAYQLYAGLVRLICMNGMIVSTAEYGSISVRHYGKDDFASRILDATYQIADTTPAVIAKVADWKQIELSPPKQLAFAKAAITLRDTKSIQPEQILEARRPEDAKPDLWSVLNRSQENLVRGGIEGKSAKGRKTRTRPISGVDSDVKTNRALWVLAEELAKLSG